MSKYIAPLSVLINKGLSAMLVRVRVVKCATDLRIFMGNHHHTSHSKQQSCTSLSEHLALTRTSLELVIFAKINVHFIRNCLDKQQQMCKGNLLLERLRILTILVTERGHHLLFFVQLRGDSQPYHARLSLSLISSCVQSISKGRTYPLPLVPFVFKTLTQRAYRLVKR